MRENKKIFSAFMDMSDTLLSGAVLWLCPRILGVSFSVQVFFLLTVLLGFWQRLFDFNTRAGLSDRHYLKRVVICEASFFFAVAVLSALGLGNGLHSRRLVALILCFCVLCFLICLKKLLVSSLFLRAPDGRMVIIGDNMRGAREFVKNVSTDMSSAELVGAVGRELEGAGCKVLGSTDELEKIILRERINIAVLAMNEYDEARIAALSARLDELYCRVYFLPVMYGLIKSSSQLEYFGTTPLLRARASALDFKVGAFFKRVFDIVLSLFLVIMTLPIMIFCAVGVKISLGRPIIFRQRRVGRYGAEFEMLKFRTMREGEPSGFDGGRDARKTRFGNFLRKTSLDELPQLVNVLSGEMSLVGPRPEIPFYVEKFKGEIPLYMLKHYAKPGITGLAQVRGLRGATSLEDRIKYDLFYIENWSLWLDIKILLMTPRKMINKNEKYRGN